MIFQLKNAIVHVVEPQYAAPEFPHFHQMDMSDFPLRVSGNSVVFRVHYDDAVSDVQYSGPAKKITFNQLGSFEIPDLRQYANTCELLQFNGRIHSARSVYELAHQLPKLQKVKIIVNSAQSTYSEEKTKYFFRTPSSPNVKTMRIIMNLDQQQCDDALSAETGIIKFVESILLYAGHSFPNLQHLVMQLPKNAKLIDTVESLLDVCPDLKTRTTLLQNVLSTENDIIEMFQANDAEYLPSDESLCSDDNPSPEPCFSANRLFCSDGYASTSNNVDVSIQSEYQRIISLLSDLDSVATPYLANPEITPPSSPGFAPSHLCESAKEFMHGSIDAPMEIEMDSFDELHLRWIEDLVR